MRICLNFFRGVLVSLISFVFFGGASFAQSASVDERLYLSLFPDEPIALTDISNCYDTVSGWAFGRDLEYLDEMVVGYWSFLRSSFDGQLMQRDVGLLNAGLVLISDENKVVRDGGKRDLLNCFTIAAGALGEMPLEEIRAEKVIKDKSERDKFYHRRESHIKFLQRYSDRELVDCVAVSFVQSKNKFKAWGYTYAVLSQELARRINRDLISPYGLSSLSSYWAGLPDFVSRDALEVDYEAGVIRSCAALNNEIFLFDQKIAEVQQ